MITARSELCKVLFLALSVTFLFVYEISREPLNGFAPNSHGRLVRPSLERVSMSRSKALSAASVRFMCGKTFLAYSLNYFIQCTFNVW